MAQEFDKEYWEKHWYDGGASASMAASPPNPHLVREVGDLAPGTALEAGCGAGAEAIWLAERGWHVTGVDISTEALVRAAQRAGTTDAAERLRWVEADLSTWEPGARFDLVTTHYAHPAMPQLAFYDRLASWVVPGGTLLIVGHLRDHAAGGQGRGHGHGHGHGDVEPPAEASVTAADITARLDSDTWEVVTADELARTLTGPGGHRSSLRDVVVRAVRR
ncbi:class I SAM-dependent methyltransferase [Nocardioides sp. DS6]|uniref:Class I SAM-dependent methyltransferase n=1 Tax=Nocardioides eburneus TaxID=3231482 RepID=A0ABV3T2K4_9ACTN